MADEQLNSAALNEVLDVYRSLGIHQLAEYQQEILQNHQFYPPQLRNLLLSAPTVNSSFKNGFKCTNL